MYDQENAAQEIWNTSGKHQLEYSNKLADLHKTVITISGVMLSVLAALGVGDPERMLQSQWLMQLSLVLFLLCLLFGFAALHGNAFLHKQALVNIGKMVSDHSPVEALHKLAFESAEQKGLYLYANNLSFASFLLGVLSLTCYALLNI